MLVRAIVTGALVAARAHAAALSAPRRYAGHSKWAKIARTKGANDAARSVVFSRASRLIADAARAGSDPAVNLRLAAAIEAAKRQNVPGDIIQRAIKSKTDVVMENMTYEGTGPSGVAFIIETLSDSRNRSAGTIRSFLTKSGGQLGSTGSSSWVFSQRGRLLVPCTKDQHDKVLEAALEAGADDIEFEEEAAADAVATVWCDKSGVPSVRAGLIAAGLQVKAGEVIRVPNSLQQVAPEDEEAFATLLEKLDNAEEVQDYVHNAA